MSNNSTNNKIDENVFSFLLVVLIFFGFMMIHPYLDLINGVLHKIEVFVLEFYHSFRGKVFLILLGVLLIPFILERVCSLIKKIARNVKRIKKYRSGNSLYERTKDSVLSGLDKKSGKSVYITDSQRTMHTQIVGTTNAGKTESVILPWAIQDIQRGHGLIIIDGKSDRSLLNKLWAYVYQAKRHKDFLLFSLSNTDESSQYNPLIGKNPVEVIERVFSAFECDDVYYKNVQYEVFSNLVWLFFHSETKLTFKKLDLALNNNEYLKTLEKNQDNEELSGWVTDFLSLSPKEREKRISGLKSSIRQFAHGDTSELFNTLKPHIDLNEALKKNKIIYFQLPVLLHPFLGRATGKMVLQDIQNAIANRHRDDEEKPKFHSLFLDDFTEYLYPGFVSILNKSRSANIGVVFSHQALGDIKTLGDGVANSILTNSNIKIFMRNTDPESAEYFSSLIGTRKTQKITERHKRTWMQERSTGDQSVREVDEFIIHPNRFKKDMGTGEAVMVVPLFDYSKTLDVEFKMIPDIEYPPVPKVIKSKPKKPRINKTIKETEKNKMEKDTKTETKKDEITKDPDVVGQN